MYDVDVSAILTPSDRHIFKLVIEWQSRFLEAVYVDRIIVKVRSDKQVIHKSIYLALDVNIEGQKVRFGMWMSETEGAKLWLNVLTEQQFRGEDILVACVDCLKGFPDTINVVYPKCQIQLRIDHLV